MRTQKTHRTHHFPTKFIAYTGIMTAMVMVSTMLGFSTAEFYFNVGDTVVLITAAILGPIPAMIAGGLGSFFADLAIYPATMFFTLFIKGIEGLVCGLLLSLIQKFIKGKVLQVTLSIISLALSALLMMTGYFICQTFIYGTYAAALVALPMDAAQAACSTALASVFLFGFKFIKYRNTLFSTKLNADKTSQN